MSERNHVCAVQQEGLSSQAATGMIARCVEQKRHPEGVFFVCEFLYSGYLATVNFVVMTSLAVGITMV